jgi:hypothetical protein
LALVGKWSGAVAESRKTGVRRIFLVYLVVVRAEEQGSCLPCSPRFV